MNKITPIQIGNKLVGPGQSCFLIAEIGINHNGDIDIAKKLIDIAVKYNFDAVKFQKRTVEIVYTKEELDRPRESPFGTTNGDLKHGLEFGETEYDEIDKYCKEKGILWFASPWDEPSIDFLEKYSPPCYKIASASLTDKNLLEYMNSKKRPIILSTGMSTEQEIASAVKLIDKSSLIILHCTSTYPTPDEELNLSYINVLRDKFQVPVGYSGHEHSLMPSVMAAIGCDACVVERHITLNRAMWGSDQAASLEPKGAELLSKYIKLWPTVKGDGIKKVYKSEIAIIEKLRRVHTLELED